MFRLTKTPNMLPAIAYDKVWYDMVSAIRCVTEKMQIFFRVHNIQHRSQIIHKNIMSSLV